MAQLSEDELINKARLMASGPIPADLKAGDKEKVLEAATLICSKI